MQNLDSHGNVIKEYPWYRVAIALQNNVVEISLRFFSDLTSQNDIMHFLGSYYSWWKYPLSKVFNWIRVGKKCYFIVSIPKQWFSLIRKVFGEKQVTLPQWALFHEWNTLTWSFHFKNLQRVFSPDVSNDTLLASGLLMRLVIKCNIRKCVIF